MITTIFLDLDDTLFSFQQAEQVALEETMRHYALPYSDEILALYSAGNDAQWKLLEQDKIQRSEIGYRRFDLLLTHLGSDLDREEVNHYYMERLSNRHFFLPGAEELLCALHGRYTLCLASNGTGWVQEGRLKSSGILPLLDRVFISEYLGANKPQLGFFDACFASLPGVKRSESLMLGDSLTSDMLGGKIAGMHTCWYNPNRLPLPTDGTVEYRSTAYRICSPCWRSCNTAQSAGVEQKKRTGSLSVRFCMPGLGRAEIAS